MKILQKLATANRIRREKGWPGIRQKITLLRRRARDERDYRKWIEAHAMTDEKRDAIRAAAARLKTRPLVSVVVPVYNVEEKWLRVCLDSVFRQLYDNWELCLADDRSPSPHVRRVLEEYAARSERVKVVFREENGHISAASNSALELATGEFTVLLDHDDELTEDALFYVAKELDEHPETDFIYSDEDLIDERGRRYEPKFKPDFSRDLLYSLNLITHLSAYRTAVLRRIGGFRRGLEGSQDYDLALRVLEAVGERRIRHIPRILYHWRAIAGSVALSSDEKPYAHERARQAIREHLARTGKRAEVVPTFYNLHRVRYALPENPPLVTLILSLDDEAARAETLAAWRAATAYPHCEVVALGDGETAPRSAAARAESLNRAAAAARGEILCFADGALRPRAADWLAELVGFAAQEEIGAVGAKILNRHETVLDAGLIVGFGDAVGVAHEGLPGDTAGNFGRLQLVNNFSAVSAACLAVRRAAFDEAGGFDAESFPHALFDADFCLRLGARGRRVVFTPYAELIRPGKRTARPVPSPAELANFRRRWPAPLRRDPFYNPNLALDGDTFAIAVDGGRRGAAGGESASGPEPRPQNREERLPPAGK